MKSKKLLLGLGGISLVATSVVSVISCGVEDIIYDVELDNAKDLNYTLSTTDNNYQPINLVIDTYAYGDMKHNSDIQNVNSILGKNADQKLITGIKDGKPYSDGLERLMYELFLAADRGRKLILSIAYTAKNKITFEIPRGILSSGKTEKEKANARAKYIVDNMNEFLSFTSIIRYIQLEPSGKGKTNPVPATEVEINAVIQKMLSKIL